MALNAGCDLLTPQSGIQFRVAKVLDNMGRGLSGS